MNIEQVKAWYEGAELVTDPDFGESSKFREPDLNTTYKELGKWWCHRKNGKSGEILLYKEGKFTAEITKYRELKVGDTVELNGFRAKARKAGKNFYFERPGEVWHFPLLGVNKLEKAQELSERILGYSDGGDFPNCRTLQDLSKLYWVGKYELEYGAREDSANTTDNKTANNMQEKRELIGYNWKEEKYARMFWELVPDKENFNGANGFATVKYDRDYTMSPDSINAETLRKENLLDLWTVPVYKDQEKVFTMGFGEDTFEVKVKDGKAYHGTDDITSFVEGLNEAFNIPTVLGGYSYTLEDKNVIFSSTGCQCKNSSLEQWDEVHDALNL